MSNVPGDQLISDVVNRFSGGSISDSERKHYENLQKEATASFKHSLRAKGIPEKFKAKESTKKKKKLKSLTATINFIKEGHQRVQLLSQDETNCREDRIGYAGMVAAYAEMLEALGVPE